MKKIASLLRSIPRKTKITAYIALAFLILAICFLASYARYLHGFASPAALGAASAQEQLYLADYLNRTYPQERTGVLKPLPYPVVSADLNVYAGAAILIDAANGCVIYEKNADEVIPPASITKLFVMYIVFQDVAAGKVSLDDVVPLPERSWAINMPRVMSKSVPS